jgi:Tetracyclin repressor-like, C-terminal domain
VLRVASSFMLTFAGARMTCADAVRKLLKDNKQWEVRSAGKGSKGERWYAWAWIATASARRSLLVRRHLGTGELAFHYCFVPEGQAASKARLITAAGLRWPVEEGFEFDALIADAEEFFTPPDHGDLGSDLRDHLGQLAAFLTTTDSGAVFRALAGQAQHTPAVAARFGLEVIARQRERDRAPFLRALERGELTGNTDIDVAIDQLAGPIYYRVLITRQDVPRRFTDSLVDRYLTQAGEH